MTHIREYPEAKSLKDWLVNLWELGVQDYMETAGLEEEPFDVDPEEIIVKGSWGRGDADLGDELEVHYVFPEIDDVDEQVDYDFPETGTDGEDDIDTEDELGVVFNAINNHVRAEMPLILDAPTIPPGPQEEYFGEITIEPPIVGEDNLKDFLVIHFQATPGEDRVYSITEEESLTIVQAGEEEEDEVSPEDVIIIRDIGKEMSYADLVEYAEAKVDEDIEDEIDVPDVQELTPSDVAEIMAGPHPDEYPEPAENFFDIPGGSVNVFIEDEEDDEEDTDEEFVIVRESLPLEPEPEEEPEPETEPEDVIDDTIDEDEEIEVGDIDISGQVDEQEGIVEVPTGKKQSTRTEYRDLYDFERELIAIGDGPTDLPAIREGIGEHMGRGSFGTTAPPISFPRTGVYLKHRLQHEGPAYVRQMHKDLCRYAWAIIEEYQVYVRPGTYEHFRGMINKYKKAGLIRPLSTSEATDLGFNVFPETPDGRTAYFLERRNFYEIVEEEIENDAWYDVTKYLYSED